MDIDHLRRRLGLVPSGERASLALLRERFRRAESELEAARAAMRSAAAAAGIERAGLFSGSKFIRRETGEAWASTARIEGEKAMGDIFRRNIDAESRDSNSPFHHLAKRLKKIQNWPEFAEKMRAAMNDPRCERARSLAEAGDHEGALTIYMEVFQKNKGAEIVAAGVRRRMGGPEVPPPEKGTLAAQIVQAGQRRRGEIE